MPKTLLSTTPLTGMTGLHARVRVYADGSLEVDAGPISIVLNMSRREVREVCAALARSDDGSDQ